MKPEKDEGAGLPPDAFRAPHHHHPVATNYGERDDDSTRLEHLGPKVQRGADFDGDTYDADLDRVRLGTQLHIVYQALRPGGWWSLTELSDASGGSEAGVSARLRDLRKPRFGGHTIERRRHSGGRWLYRLVPKAAP